MLTNLLNTCDVKLRSRPSLTRRRRKRAIQPDQRASFILYQEFKEQETLESISNSIFYSTEPTMKLKSCFSSNDEDENEIKKDMETKSCCRQHAKLGGNFSCPQTCSSVIDEYKQTRMSFIREKLDKTQINEDIKKSQLFTSTSTDENENRITKRRQKYLKKKIVTKAEKEVSSSEDEVTESEDKTSGASNASSSYEDKFEKSLEDLHGVEENIAELLRKRSFNFGEVDVNNVNRFTNLSTKSNSDSQLERTSAFLKNNSDEQSFLSHATSSVIKKETSGSGAKIPKFLEILKELIETERNYVASLRDICEEYIPEMQRKDIVQGLRGQKFAVFCNVEKIYHFHSEIFLTDLEECISDWKTIGKCFLKHEKTFDIYSVYNKNKPKSDELMTDYGAFFEEKRIELGHSLNLSSLLVKPVQRLARYSLLLEKLLKECELGCEAYLEILHAKEMIIYTLRHGNDLLVMDGIKNCDVNLNEQGKLLRQEEFLLIEDNGKKALKRRIFLFEELILLSIPSKTNSDEYMCCNSMKMTDVGLTDSGELNKFIIWFRKYQFQKYTFQADSPEVKTAWVKEITNILMRQAEQYKLSKIAELEASGIQSQTRIPILEEESDEDEQTSNKKYYSMRSLRGVAGEIKPKKIIDRTTWYCTLRTEENEPAS